ncbi:MAG: hypothetical protein HY735_18770 [Verrucomicrobia bacterium]|nr:hypothetical protein [Verrucomicrobiota bacterium]
MSFADFPAQQPAVSLLQRSLDRGRLSHAYMFVGGSLEELSAAARTLAKALVCSEPPRRGSDGVALDCCDRCVQCRRTDDDNHSDVHWVKPEAKSRVITIDQIRELMRAVFLKPLEAPWKVAVIVAADRLNTQAANAFLKTLEEPPARSVVLLLSTEPERILETISSRCLRLIFSSAAAFQAAPAQAEWLSRFADIAVHRPKSLLGRYRLLSAMLSRLTQIKAETQKTLESKSPLNRFEDIDPHLREKWEDELTAAVEAEYRLHRGEVLLSLEWWLRDVWLQTLGLSEDFLAWPQLAAATRAVAGRISVKQAAENLHLLEDTHRLLGSNVQEALALEVGVLRWHL